MTATQSHYCRKEMLTVHAGQQTRKKKLTTGNSERVLALSSEYESILTITCAKT